MWSHEKVAHCFENYNPKFLEINKIPHNRKIDDTNKVSRIFTWFKCSSFENQKYNNTQGVVINENYIICYIKIKIIRNSQF